ncbi:hypothetical protein MRX96_053806 [Rhipicephalus microplus]
MPDSTARRATYRLCDSVNGANWCPTLFLDEQTLSGYACVVCRVSRYTDSVALFARPVPEASDGVRRARWRKRLSPVHRAHGERALARIQFQKAQLPPNEKDNLKGLFEIDDRCLLNAKATRTHEHLPPLSKERRPGRSGARVSTADYHIVAEDRRCHNVKRLSTAPTSEEATLSKPKQTAAAIQRWRKSGVVRAFREQGLRGRRPKSTDRSRRSVHHPEPDDGIEERRRLLPIATTIPKHGRHLLCFHADWRSEVRRNVRGATRSHKSSRIRALSGTSGTLRSWRRV